MAELQTQNSAEHEPDSLSAEFERLERAWTDALVRQDRPVLERFLAPEYALTVSAAPDQPVDRESWLATAEVYQISAYSIDMLRARRVGNTVVVSAIYDIEATVNGVDRSRVFFITDVWVPTPDGWKVGARYSSMPEQESQSSRAVTKP